VLSAVAAKAGATARELAFELHCLRRHYPPFVTRNVERLEPGAVPVFTFHTIEPEPFAAQLAHLQQNGYRTIDGATLLSHLRGEVRAPADAVMLTIDDGRKSVWTYGVPLLRRYGFCATLFLIPGYVPGNGGVGPSLDDVDAGRLSPAELGVRDPELMTWDEIRAAQQSGVIDCQSHTCFHHRVPVAPTLEGFVGPANREAFFDVPVPAGEEWRLAAAGVPGAFGMPLFTSAPLMHARPRFHPAQGVVEACVDLVQSGGGAAFFAAPDAMARLRATYDAAVRACGGGRVEPPAEARMAVRDDLARSRSLIEAELGGKPCSHLCFPYTEGSEVAVQLAREVGYQAAYWGVLPSRTINRQGDDPLSIVRLKNDYIHRLPGQGRRSIAGILLDKLRRRAAGGPVY
jgi:peptidoglycan/xylan/chitin deacetylase (PgdA/CDA1 family)